MTAMMRLGGARMDAATLNVVVLSDDNTRGLHNVSTRKTKGELNSLQIRTFYLPYIQKGAAYK